MKEEIQRVIDDFEDKKEKSIAKGVAYGDQMWVTKQWESYGKSEGLEYAIQRLKELLK